MLNKRNFLASAILVLASLFLGAGTSWAWDLQAETDDFGSPYVQVTTYFGFDSGSHDYSDDLNEDEEFAVLFVRCQDRQLESYVALTSGLFSSDSNQAKVRFGSGSAKTWSTNISQSRKSIFFLKESTFLASLKKVSKFYVRADGEDGYVTVNFNVAGLSKYQSKFRKAGCKF